MPFAAVNGIDLYFESHGSGPAIVFAHGAGGNHLSWWQQVPVFQSKYRCITFDHRAFGLSRDVADGPGRTAFAPDVLALVDELGIDRFFVVAQSMGGRTASGLVRRAPERLRGIVLAGTIGGSVDDEVRELQREHRESLPPGSTLFDRALWPEFAREHPEMAFLYRQVQRLNPKRPPDFLAAQPGYRGTSSGLLLESGVPIMFLAGEHDAIVPRHIVERAARLVPGSRVTIIPAAGHSAYFEMPHEFNAAVIAFLDEIESRELSGAASAPGDAGIGRAS